MAQITTLKLPKEVIDFKADYETYGDNKAEMEYVSPQKVSKESIEKIKEIKLKNQERGHKLFMIFNKNEKIAA